MRVNARIQSGLTLSGMLITLIILALIVVFGMRIVPDVVEYAKILSAVKAVAQDPTLKQASATEVRKAYEKRAVVDNIRSITPQEIDVNKDGGNLVLSFAYTKRIPMAGPVSLLIDFEGSSAK